MKVCNILETIGNTPLVKLNKIGKTCPAMCTCRVETFPTQQLHWTGWPIQNDWRRAEKTDAWNRAAPMRTTAAPVWSAIAAVIKGFTNVFLPPPINKVQGKSRCLAPLVPRWLCTPPMWSPKIYPTTRFRRASWGEIPNAETESATITLAARGITNKPGRNAMGPNRCGSPIWFGRCRHRWYNLCFLKVSERKKSHVKVLALIPGSVLRI